MRQYILKLMIALGFVMTFMFPALAGTCSSEHKLKSLKGDIGTTIIFQNRGASEEDSFKIYWIDYKGKRIFYKHLFKGRNYAINTYITHPWVITAPVPGGGENCVGIYMPDPGRRTVILR